VLFARATGGSLGPAVIGLLVGGVLVALMQRSSQREQLIQGHRIAAYVDVLTYLRRELTRFERTYPVVGPPAAPPASRPDDDELFTLNARVVGFGSVEM
jgi:hypothetical protein